MKKRSLLIILISALTVFFSSASIFAAAPSKALGFQGQLFSNGTPLSSSVNATFTFYNSLSGGSTTGSPISKTITVANGYFGTQFTEADTTGVNFDQDLYIQVNINGTDLSPRTAINAAPTALKAFGTFSYASAPTVGPVGSLYFNTVDGKLYTSNGTAWSSASSVWSTNGTFAYYNAGSVGIGTTTAASSTTALTIDLGLNQTQGIHITGTKDKFIFLERLGSGGRGLVIGQQNGGQMYGGNASVIRSAGTLDEVIEISPGRDLSLNKGSVQIAPFGGLVSIGNASPAYKLDIASSSSANAVDMLRFQNTANAAANTGASILFTANRSGETATDVARLSGAITDITAGAYKGALIFSTANNAAPAERMRLDSNGFLGIGTTAPTARFDINDGGIGMIIGADNNGNQTRTNNTTKVGRIASPHYTNNEEPMAMIFSSSGTSTSIVSFGGGSAVMNAATEIRFFTAADTITTGGTSRMVIDTNGNVGIGTTTPTTGSRLDIWGNMQVGTSSLPAFFVDSSTSRIGVGTTTPGRTLTVAGLGMQIYRSGGGVPHIEIIQGGAAADLRNWRLNGEIDGSFNIYPMTDANSNLRPLRYTHDGRLQITNSTMSNVDARLYVDSNSVASTSAVFMNGFVGIGTTTPTANLTASGTIRFSSLVGGGANLVVDSLGNVTVSSDERLKDIKGMFTTGLDKILALNPISYKWKPETGYDTTNTYAGFSAQNVQSAIPEAVGTDNRGFLTLADRPILAALVNAVKELAVKIGNMSNKVQTKELCLDDVCITKDQLRTILQQQNNININTINVVTPPPTTSTTTVEITPAPAPTPELVAPVEPATPPATE
ncbi:MAG: tail fiber domain-containing protein [Patescibacteria group bacterium]